MGFRDDLQIPPRIRPGVEVFRYALSGLICVFGLFIISYGVIAEQSGFSKVFPGIPGWLVFLITIVCFLFLGLIEGLQAAILALQRHSGEIFRERYPTAYDAHALISGKNSKNTSKFLIGRQVQVIFTVFFIALLTSFPEMVNFPFTNSPFPGWFRSVFIEQGILSAIVVACVSQLVPQLIATKFPVQFMNIRGCKLVIETALWIDTIGIAHFTWVLCAFFAKVFRMNPHVTQQIQKGEVVQGDRENVGSSSLRIAQVAFLYARYVLSGLLTVFCLFLVLYGLFRGESQFTTTFNGAPGWLGFILFIVVQFWLALLEGSQVCIINLSRLPNDSYEMKYPRAAALQAKCNSVDAVSRYLIGRQLGVIFSVFIASNMTTLTGMEYFPFTNSAFPEWIRTFILSTGLLGGFVTVVFAQVFPKLIAAKFPVQIMNIFGLNIVVWVSWIFELPGLCHASRLMSWAICHGFKFNKSISNEIDECIVVEDNAAASEQFWNFTLPPLQPEGTKYVQPHRVANQMMNDNIRVPSFLFPPDHSNHVPPHVVALEFMNLLGHTPYREEAKTILYNRLSVSPQLGDTWEGDDTNSELSSEEEVLYTFRV